MRSLIAFAVWASAGIEARTEPSVFSDPAGDAVIRRTDAGANNAVDSPPHAKPDLIAYQIGNWQPVNALVDAWFGAWSPQGEFVRLDVHFSGLLNPPGPQALILDKYDPYRYGLHPVYGFFEFDVDGSVSTGGEAVETQWRYLANACRFGSKPAVSRFANRYALEGASLDGNVSTPPYVERSGEEFHLALLGDRIDQILVLNGDTDQFFEPNETWVVRGTFLHRAHVFERYSNAGGDGIYEPMVSLRWQHSAPLNVTIISLVYPLTNAASAELRGDPTVEPLDGSDLNQNSIQEGLNDVVTSLQLIPAMDPRRLHPTFPMVAGWEGGAPVACLDSSLWDDTFLVGMTYPVQDPSGGLYAWTDVMPGGKPGDFSGDGHVDGIDVMLFNQYIQERDGTYRDLDGVVNGAVVLPTFGPNFSVFDVNYDGQVNPGDRQAVVIPGDLDADFDVDMDDVVLFVQSALSPTGIVPGPSGLTVLQRADFNSNGRIDGGDVQGFVEAFLGYTG